MEKILEILEKNNFQVSTDTRRDVYGTVFFAIKGENFDGNKFVEDAIKKGAVAAVCSAKINLPNVFVVRNTLATLQKAAAVYRKKFSIPIVVIGGSNGKTTSKDLLAEALKTKFNVLKTEGSFNNHLGVPLTLLAMKPEHQIAVLEIGANHPKEHTNLLDIINPTHVVVTNNGMDHLEGFGSPAGARKANKEIFDWAAARGCPVFVSSKHKDLLADSKKCARIKYPTKKDALKIGKNVAPLDIVIGSKKYKTKLSGEYNLENIELAVSIASSFGVPAAKSLGAICEYVPESKRSQIFEKDGIEFTLDCYNANPTSMMLSIESFDKSGKKKRGVILGDMLELGKFSNNEHQKIVRLVKKMKFDATIFIGPRFKKVLLKEKFSFRYFDSSEKAAAWFRLQNFSGHSFLLKGSRGMKIEKVVEKQSRKLSEILAGVKIIERDDNTDISVSKICFDSRKIITGSLFVAISGTNKDGSEFIDDAINSGATVIVYEKPFLKKKPGVIFIMVSDARAALSLFAQNFYGNPSRDLKIVGITGTNGKTTTATLLFDLFRKLKLPAAKITTIENKINDDVYPATQTTPDPVALAEFFAASVACGVTYVFMECSSHAIDQKRILGLNFAGGIFTNLTLDHLDYHKTMGNYALAKKTFFDYLPPQSFALANLDDEKSKFMLKNTKAEKYFFSLKAESDFYAEIPNENSGALRLKIKNKTIKTSLVGRFNAYNILGIFSAAKLLGLKESSILKVLPKLSAPRGRMETIESKNGIRGIVDYAHTPDALLNVLMTLKKARTKENKIITVVGCGGDRDKSKRPVMGSIACDNSDFVIFTADNSRNEETKNILSDIVKDLSARNFKCAEDRAEAIKAACKMAQPGDIVLVAGKGHENYQIFKDKTTHFSDTEELKKYI